MPSTRKAVLIRLPLFIVCTTFLAGLVALLLVNRSFSRAALKRGLEGAIAGQEKSALSIAAISLPVVWQKELACVRAPSRVRH